MVEPHCIGCHALQGSTAGETLQANAINFSSYEKFISYRDEIKDYVYQRGIMPLSLRNYEKFWKKPNRAPALLASFLNDTSLFDSHGVVVQPGLAIARLGNNHTVKSPIQLDASNSLFSSVYSWKIDKKPTGSTALLSDENAIRPLLSVNMDGEYDISLTVSGLRGNSSSVTQHITAKSSQKPFTFTHDVMPILSTCTSCHNDNSNLPVSWQADDQLYSRVMARVNLKNPEMSKLLTKPIGSHHGGGMQIDLNKVDGQMQYNALLNWINEGAVK